MQGTIKRGAVPPKRFLAWFGRNQVNFFKVRLCTDAFLRRKAVEKSSYDDKPFAAQTPPRKRGYGRISPDKTHFAPPKAQKLSFRTVHKTVMRNRRATGARICGSVRSKTIFGKSVIFHITQTVNRTYFYNQLAVA